MISGMGLTDVNNSIRCDVLIDPLDKDRISDHYFQT